jgi:hypothetical protein
MISSKHEPLYQYILLAMLIGIGWVSVFHPVPTTSEVLFNRVVDAVLILLNLRQRTDVPKETL